MNNFKSQLVVFSLLTLFLISCNSGEKTNPLVSSDKNTPQKDSSILSSYSYNVNITGPSEILVSGESTTITGIVTDKNGNVVSNEQIGVEDGLGWRSSLTKTDDNGNINYETDILAQGAGIVVFIIRGERYPFIFQSTSKKSGNTYYTNNLNLSALSINNTSSSDFSVQTTSYNGITYNQTLEKNNSLTIIKSIQNSLLKRVTVFGGASFSVGFVVGGQTSVTVDNNGVGTVSIGGGVALYRGQVYATSNKDLGACWAPGGNLGVTPISLDGEVTLCAGTDGINLGLSGEAGGITGGFQIKLY
jgi:hypothetical protein